MNALVDRVLSQRNSEVNDLKGFKAQPLEGTNNICECDEDGEPDC